MQKPPKKSKADLIHPKEPKKSKFNGDRWRNDGAKNFTNTVRTVEGTNRPGNSKPVSVGSRGDHRDITGAIKPIPLGHQFQPAMRDIQEVNASQVKQLTDRQKKKYRSR